MAIFLSGYIQQPPEKQHVVHVISTNHLTENVSSYGTHNINNQPLINANN
jgi:hypothetical protein